MRLVMSPATVHEPLAGIVAPLSDTDPAPAFAVNVPPQVLDPFAGVWVRRAAGKVSVNATLVWGRALGFVRVMVRREVPFSGIDEGTKTLATVGGAKTFRVADVGGKLEPAFVLVPPPAGIVFRYEPAGRVAGPSSPARPPPAGVEPPKWRAEQRARDGAAATQLT